MSKLDQDNIAIWLRDNRIDSSNENLLKVFQDLGATDSTDLLDLDEDDFLLFQKEMKKLEFVRFKRGIQNMNSNNVSQKKMAWCGEEKDLSFQKYKLERFFYLLDVDNNQRVEEADIVLWVDKAAGYLEEDGVSVSEEQKNLLFKQIKRIFNVLTAFGLAGKSNKSFANYLMNASKLPFFKSFLNNFVKAVLEALDFNGDGKVSWKEFYNIMMKPVGLTEEDAKLAFSIIDLDGNGELSIDELTSAVVGYYSDKEVTEYAFAFGKIPVHDVPETFKESVNQLIEQQDN